MRPVNGGGGAQVAHTLVECVPNFSEGRRPEVVAGLRQAIAAVPTVHVLDVHVDPDHNRSVITFAGPRAAVAEAAFRGVATAAQAIDLRQHRGVHPRIGACDVLPFVPLGEAALEDCVALAAEVGERIARELELPVYLYGAAARRPDRRRLADVRRGQYEGLREAIAGDPDRAPDFGPRRLGPAGAVAVGARRALIAYNVCIEPADLELARAVAREVREADGGLPGVQALGLAVSSGVQVSLNIVDYHATPPHRALAAVRAATERRGGRVLGAELVGLLPLEAALAAAGEALGLGGLPPERVLELAAAAQWRDWELR